ncbi:helix-turn-helix transcriptional regulator [Lentzea sp. NPDC051838]|uniref:helix-turn-helix domain-containing protein n=1 Tax=Lentzea sp. NPDC051838 TaxID=3154849 RepID=UPI00343DCD72
MASPELRLDPHDGPLHQFAFDLRGLRAAAGTPSYRELAQRTHYSTSTLADAARGLRKPSLDVVVAFVRACDGDVGEWTARWHALDRVAVEPDGWPLVRAALIGAAVTAVLIGFPAVVRRACRTTPKVSSSS